MVYDQPGDKWTVLEHSSHFIYNVVYNIHPLKEILFFPTSKCFLSNIKTPTWGLVSKRYFGMQARVVRDRTTNLPVSR